MVDYDAPRMRDTWKAAKVGLMVAIGLAAMFAVYRYVDEAASGDDGITVYALFPDAQGLIPKSRVVIAGIPVGHIDTIRLAGQQARVDIQIDEGIELHDDATITMHSASLLGEKVLVLSPGTMTVDENDAPVVPLLEDGDRIQNARESVEIDDLLTQANEILTNVNAVTEQLAGSFGTDEAGDRMDSALRNLSEALEAINRTIQTNETVVNNTLSNLETATEEATPRLVRILDNVEVATRHVAEVIDNQRPDIERAVDEVDDTVASIRRASEELEGVLGDVRQVTDRTARGEGTVGRLTSDETLIDEVEGAAEGINNLIGGFARLQTIVELRSEYNFFANTFKTYFSLRLQPREDRYYLVQIVDDPRGDVSFEQTLVRRTPPAAGEPAEYQETRITRSDALRFTLQFAKRVGFATVRFGIMESTGGLGFDLHFFGDRLEFQSDFFAIGEETFPRVRVRAAFEVVRRFWVLGGVDDILNESNDFFLGMMLRFNDEDLASLLPLLGLASP